MYKIKNQRNSCSQLNISSCKVIVVVVGMTIKNEKLFYVPNLQCYQFEHSCMAGKTGAVTRRYSVKVMLLEILQYSEKNTCFEVS